jgi:hypothetical protein
MRAVRLAHVEVDCVSSDPLRKAMVVLDGPTGAMRGHAREHCNTLASRAGVYRLAHVADKQMQCPSQRYE